MHRPVCRSGGDPPLVYDALAARGNLPGDAQALGIRDATPGVGFGDPKDYTGTVGAVLVGGLVRASPDEASSGRPAASGGMVPQGSFDLRRCARVGAKRVVGSGGADFLRVAFSDRHGESP